MTAASKYESSAIAFQAAHPIGSGVRGSDVLKWATAHGNGLAIDLLITEPAKRLSAVKRHLNNGGASFNLPEDSRFQIIAVDPKRDAYEVVAYADYVEERTESAVYRSINGAITPLKQGRNAINDVKLDELADEDRQRLEERLAEITDAATPLSAVLGEIAVTKWVRRLVSKGFTETAARTLLNVAPELQREIKLIAKAKF